MLIPMAENTFTVPLKETLNEGQGYFYHERPTDEVFELFADYANHGYAGLCFTRAEPDTLREEFSLLRTPILKISASNLANTIHPQDLGSLEFYIKSLCESSEKAVIIIHGLDYLLDIN